MIKRKFKKTRKHKVFYFNTRKHKVLDLEGLLFLHGPNNPYALFCWKLSEAKKIKIEST
jgi:hypothetical protein